MFVVRHRTPFELQEILSAAAGDSPSYPEVGATQDAILPSGYRHDRRERRIGDPEVFDRAALGLRHWAAHDGAGVRIFPRDRPVTTDLTILALFQFGPTEMIAPCRIVRVIDDVNEFGFAYATLPGHPERGEEAFTVERRGDGTYFEITAFSRPEERLVRFVAPFARAVQVAVTNRYVEALARYVASQP